MEVDHLIDPNRFYPFDLLVLAKIVDLMIKFWFLGGNDANYDVIARGIFFETWSRFFSDLHVSMLFREAKNTGILINFCTSKK